MWRFFKIQIIIIIICVCYMEKITTFFKQHEGENL